MNEINAQLRIYVSKKYFPLYQEITRGLFQQNSEFFMLCTFLGEKKGQKIPVEKRRELFHLITMSEYDIIAIKSLHLKEFGHLGTQKEWIDVAEEYANGGLAYLIDTALKDYVHESEDGEWHLKPNVEMQDLQLVLFDHVLKESTEVPF